MDTRPHTIYVDEIDSGHLPIPTGNYRQSIAPPTPPPYHASRRFHDREPFIISDDDEDITSTVAPPTSASPLNEVIRAEQCAVQSDRVEVLYSSLIITHPLLSLTPYYHSSSPTVLATYCYSIYYIVYVIASFSSPSLHLSLHYITFPQCNRLPIVRVKATMTHYL